MALPHGTRAQGQRHVTLMKAGYAVAKGDLVQTTEATGSNQVDVAATNKAVYGHALEAIASGAVGNVDMIFPGDQFWVLTTTIGATNLGKFADIVNQLSVTATNSNNDARYMAWDGVTTTFAVVEYTRPESVSVSN